MTPVPRLYAIIDADRLPSGMSIMQFAAELIAGGISLLQYRNKSGNARRMLEDARGLRELNAKLIMNDRADLCLAASLDGVHVGQDDLSPAAVRSIIGDKFILGVSTHNPEQVRSAGLTTADYIAVGPVFATASKLNPDPMVGLEGVRRARALTGKPLVAIGGITRQNCRSVIEAGADCVAVIADLLVQPRKSAEAFLRILG